MGHTINRRQILKAIGAGGVTAGAFSGRAAAHTVSGEYEVWVYPTQELYDRSLVNATANFLDYLLGAFNNTNNVTVRAHNPFEPIPAPTEQAHEGSDETFIADSPCNGAPTEYPNLAWWWLEYIDCVIGGPVGDDSNLLITDSWDAGGYAFFDDDDDGYAAVSEGGPRMNNDSGYEEFANDYESKAHWVALQEVGHNFQMTDVDAEFSLHHSAYNQHQTGVTTQTSGFNAHMVTPLGGGLCNRDDDQNECGDFAETDVSCGTYGDWMRYSDCSVSLWNNPR